jgi:tetratricopeptide (TPR) repeat protein
MRVSRLGEAYLLAGRVDEARRRAREALETARGHGERSNEAWARRLLGEIASRADAADVDTAAGHYREALALADELGMRPLVAHCHLGLGRLHWRAAKREHAEAHLTAATTMYRDMDMRSCLASAETERAPLP